MEIRFDFYEGEGSIIIEDENIEIMVDKDREIYKALSEELENGLIDLKKFKNDGIPGKIKYSRKYKDKEDVLMLLKKFEKTFNIHNVAIVNKLDGTSELVYEKDRLNKEDIEIERKKKEEFKKRYDRKKRSKNNKRQKSEETKESNETIGKNEGSDKNKTDNTYSTTKKITLNGCRLDFIPEIEMDSKKDLLISNGHIIYANHIGRYIDDLGYFANEGDELPIAWIWSEIIEIDINVYPEKDSDSKVVVIEYDMDQTNMNNFF